MPPSANPTSVIILAAGLGKRMFSSLPKPLIPVCGRSMLFHILDQVSEVAPQARVAVVVGHQKETVIKEVKAQNFPLEIDFIEQSEQKGTGHAVKCVMESTWGKETVPRKENVLVLPGDLPLMQADLVREMMEPLKRGSAMKLLSAVLPDPHGYGRIVRKGKQGTVLRIVEEKDANVRERMINEVGVSIYTFNSAFLSGGVAGLKNNNAQKEYYLTDLIALAVTKKRTIETHIWDNSEDVRGVNNPYELAQAGDILNNRVIKKHALNGVRFVCLNSCRVDPTVKIAQDVTIYPNVILEGSTEISGGTMIGHNVFLKNVKVGKGAEIKAGTYAEDSIIGDRVKLGPYAHLRPESVIKEDAKVGNFVELKKTTIGAKTSVAHLSYLGDATVGAGVNIGCGFVTCNFDGRVIDGSRKHKTIIEDNVFVGSDCQVIAPITLKKGSYVASGSTLTDDLEEDALAIARSRQVTKPGYAKKLRG
ncbi:MAG: bifunctional UDP-N-acetylglucosamine diphosphorylase/glucosamine-1-phosphate N-acetyltransferase GlmU [Bdellovibrionales bacterium]|nr:bifunctional UDP-N-acetylglucosamine diphosphorylase/glucosamine-1-phosphate N-acetyltransferase GlmU [Oligoflexia bacterium]